MFKTDPEFQILNKSGRQKKEGFVAKTCNNIHALVHATRLVHHFPVLLYNVIFIPKWDLQCKTIDWL